MRRPLIAMLPLALLSLHPVQITAAPGDRQRAFTEAAREFQVPVRVLLGLSYLESRWDVNAGRPSTDAGFGPMHLTDAAAFTTGKNPVPEALSTLERAAALTGLSHERLREDPAANIRGGAALLAAHQRDLGAPLSRGPAQWYGAVARYASPADRDAAQFFADEVYATIRKGVSRTTDDGHLVTLRPRPAVQGARHWLDRLGLKPATRRRGVECPAGLPCEWIPAKRAKLPGGGYGNFDTSDRPRNQKIDYIVIHDMEGYWRPSVDLLRDPARAASWHYSIRAADGYIAQHLKTKDVGWQAGNWYVNAKSIGLEHEGFLAERGSWYTEVMYRASARLVRYLAAVHRVPLDRAHILGHDNVPGTLPATVSGMHEDPGPFWDWAHYFDLLGSPLRPVGGQDAGAIMIRPAFAANKPRLVGCDRARPTLDCPPTSASAVWLRTEPRADAPLVGDPGKKNPGTFGVHDHSARAATGQRYAVAERGDGWIAIWYLGRKAWFEASAAIPSAGLVVTPRPGLADVPVYGRAYPERGAYPADGSVPYQAITPLQYTFAAGQRYTLSGVQRGEYYRAVTLDPAAHRVIRGKLKYYQIQFGHRTMFVRADDVVLAKS